MSYMIRNIPRSDLFITFSLSFSIIVLIILIYENHYNKNYNPFSVFLFGIGFITFILLVIYRKHLKGFL